MENNLVANPPLDARATLGRFVPPFSVGKRLYFAKQPSLRVNVKRAPSRGEFLHRNFPSAPIRAQAPNRTITHKSIPLHKLQQVKLDVVADHAIRFDNRAGFAINVVPAAAELRAQPPAQGAKMFAKTFAILM